MITYKDRTFCVSLDCDREHRVTDRLRSDAEAFGLPLSVAELCRPSVLLVGEAPAVPGGRPLHPDDSRSGRRLLQYTGWIRDEYLGGLAARANVFDEPQAAWDLEAARRRVETDLVHRVAREGYTHLVLLGRRVVDAFRPRHCLDPRCAAADWDRDVGLVAAPTWGPAVYACPHPSGRNRWWNSPANRLRARGMFEQIKGEARDRAAPALTRP